MDAHHIGSTRYNFSMREPLEARIGRLLRDKNLRLATAESCTGGLIGDRVTNVPGSSDYFLGGVIAYANQVKMGQLGVNQETLERHGAVSEATVCEMAQGVRAALSAEVGLSVSGIAGPGGGSADKPVGLTWIGLSAPGVEWARRFVFQGDRLAVKRQAAQAALELLLEYLQS